MSEREQNKFLRNVLISVISGVVLIVITAGTSAYYQNKQNTVFRKEQKEINKEFVTRLIFNHYKELHDAKHLQLDEKMDQVITNQKDMFKKLDQVSGSNVAVIQ